MITSELLFWFFSAAMLLCGLLVVLNPNPVASALLLVQLFFFMAALFVLLEAFFLAVIQIMVYAGAVMVLFLFVIMLLDPKEPRRWWMGNKLGLIGGPIAASVTIGLIIWLLNKAEWALPDANSSFNGNIEKIVKPLFTEYLLPLEVVALILLVAIVGVVTLGRREAAKSPEDPQ